MHPSPNCSSDSEKRTKSVRENERATICDESFVSEECVEDVTKKKKEKDEEDVNAALVRLREQALLRRHEHESRVVVDEISRRVCRLVVENVVEKEVVTSELLAALEGICRWDEGRFFSKRYLRYMRIEQHERTKISMLTIYASVSKDETGAANVFSTVLYYDFERR